MVCVVSVLRSQFQNMSVNVNVSMLKVKTVISSSIQEEPNHLLVAPLRGKVILDRDTQSYVQLYTRA